MIKTSYLGVFWMVLADLQHWTLNAWVLVRVPAQWHTQDFILLAVVKQNLHVCSSTVVVICVHWYKWFVLLLLWGKIRWASFKLVSQGSKDERWENSEVETRSPDPRGLGIIVCVWSFGLWIDKRRFEFFRESSDPFSAAEDTHVDSDCKWCARG